MSKEAEDEGGVRIATAPYRNIRTEEKGSRLSLADMSREREGFCRENLGGEDDYRKRRLVIYFPKPS